MTEKIDLDELDVESDEETPNRGDWFWRDDGDPGDEPEVASESASSAVDPAAPSADAGEGTGTTTEESDAATDDGDPADSPVPHVPRENKDKPVGIPKESGGAGGESSAAAATDPPDHAAASGGDADAAAGESGQSAGGPHGGGVDDMTLALTYEAMKRFEDPTLVVRDAKAWADWLGIVGDVEAYVINKFQRENNIDVDFFSGSESPAERLADVDQHSMFYAERMVLVGLPPEESIAEAAGWEFVPLSEAAEKADWEWRPDPGEDG